MDVSQSAAFDDFLGLREQSFARRRLVLFHGASGSGKSTAIQWLVANHADFHAARVCVVRPKISGWTPVPRDAEWAIVDEIEHVAELGRIAGLLARGHRVVVASHVPIAFTRPLLIAVRSRVFRTDRDPAKLARHLQRRNVAWSPAALESYTARFGASYAMLDIILEYGRVPDLDRCLARFERQCRAETDGSRNRLVVG